MNSFNRRDFLRDTFRSALGLSVALSTPRIFSQSITGGQRPFQMIVLGDSLMWGQGLRPELKFHNIVAKWLADIFAGQRSVPEPLMLAHSDANIFPVFDRNWDFTTERVSRESPVENPAILFQASKALAHFKRDGRAPSDVDLILLNGGINDFMVERFLQPNLSGALVEAYAKRYCGQGMQLLLTFLATAFPNARMIVVGYYRLVSTETDRDFVRRTLLRSVFGSAPKRLLNIPFVPENRILRDELAKRSEWWFDASTRHLDEAVKTVNGEFPINLPDARRITFVPTPFGKENSYGANASLVWELNKKLEPEDHMFDTRKVTCDLEGLKGIEREICRRAAAFHPNPNGACKYAEAIKKALIEILPSTDWVRK